MTLAHAALQPYDFRTGTELSREALSHLRAQCDRLAAALGRVMHAYLDCPTEFAVGACEATSFDRYLAELPELVVLGLVEFGARLPGVWWQMDAALAGAVLGRMLGGPPDGLPRRATGLEMAVLRRFFQELMDVWSTSWRRMAGWSPAAAQVMADGGQLQTVVHASEIVRVTMQVEVANVAGRLDLLLPVGTAQRMVSEEPGPGATETALDVSAASRSAGAITVPVAVVVHRGRLSLSEAMRVSEGDVLALGKPLDEPLTIAVRGQPKFIAQAGVRAGRIAARIIGPAPSPNR